MKTYPLASYVHPSHEELVALGLDWRKPAFSFHIKAVRTGEFRAPKAGEWYISGAIPEAYRAPLDYFPESQYHICKLVRVETVERIVK